MDANLYGRRNGLLEKLVDIGSGLNIPNEQSGLSRSKRITRPREGRTANACFSISVVTNPSLSAVMPLSRYQKRQDEEYRVSEKAPYYRIARATFQTQCSIAKAKPKYRYAWKECRDAVWQ